MTTGTALDRGCGKSPTKMENKGIGPLVLKNSIGWFWLDVRLNKVVYWPPDKPIPYVSRPYNYSYPKHYEGLYNGEGRDE